MGGSKGVGTRGAGQRTCSRWTGLRSTAAGKRRQLSNGIKTMRIGRRGWSMLISVALVVFCVGEGRMLSAGCDPSALLENAWDISNINKWSIHKSASRYQEY